MIKKSDMTISDLFDLCLDRMLIKGEDMEHILLEYPKHKTELEPLLKTAFHLNKSLQVESNTSLKTKILHNVYKSTNQTKNNWFAKFRLSLGLMSILGKRSILAGWKWWQITLLSFIVLLCYILGGLSLGFDNNFLILSSLILSSLIFILYLLFS